MDSRWTSRATTSRGEQALDIALDLKKALVDCDVWVEPVESGWRVEGRDFGGGRWVVAPSDYTKDVIGVLIRNGHSGAEYRLFPYASKI